MYEKVLIANSQCFSPRCLCVPFVTSCKLTFPYTTYKPPPCGLSLTLAVGSRGWRAPHCGFPVLLTGELGGPDKGVARYTAGEGHLISHQIPRPLRPPRVVYLQVRAPGHCKTGGKRVRTGQNRTKHVYCFIIFHI